MKRIRVSSQMFLFVTLGLLLIVNILLIFQNLNLKAQLKKDEPVEVKEGDIFDAFQAKNLSGNETKIDYSENSSKRVLLFFRTSCGYCKKQMPYWKDLVKNIDPEKYKVSAITTETDQQAIKNYLKDYKVEDWDVLSIKPEDAQKAKLLATPITVVINNKGVVEKVWSVMWSDKEIADVSNYFSIDFNKVEADMGQ